MEPVMLEDLEKIMIEAGELPYEVEKVSPEEIEQLKKDFPLDGDKYVPEGKPEPVIVPDDKLVEPDDEEKPDEPDMFEAEQAVGQEEEIKEQTTYIHEEILEETVTAEEEPAELPPFPDHP